MALRYAKKLAGRIMRLFGWRGSDIWESHYEHERALFRYTLMERPWLSDGPARQAPAHDVDVIEFDLLRYAHAIDKGLQLADRRSGFGIEKIRCILRMLAYLNLSDGGSRQVFGWSLGILRRYRQVLDTDLAGSELDDDNRQRLTEWARELDEALGQFDETDSYDTVAPTCDGLSPIYFSRRSVRQWTDRPVDDATLKTLVEAALWAPASCNRQPHKFLFIRDAEKKRLAIEVAAGGTGFADRAPVLVVLLNDVRAYYAPSERHLAYIDTTLAAQNFVLAACELGLGPVLLSMACEDTSAVDRFRSALGIPDWYATIALIALGYPKDSSPCVPSVRRSVEAMMVFDGFSEGESHE